MQQPYTPLAHSVTIRGNGELPHRVVLIDKGHEYVVWYQTFTADSPHTHDSYYQGSYFPIKDKAVQKNAMAAAWDEFSRRNAQLERYALISDVCKPQ